MRRLVGLNIDQAVRLSLDERRRITRWFRNSALLRVGGYAYEVRKKGSDCAVIEGGTPGDRASEGGSSAWVGMNTQNRSEA